MNCDGIASYYEVVEHMTFMSHLERRRFAFVGESRTARRAIVCGGGDGRFLARLLRANARVQVDFVEVSSRMIDLAERRVTGMGPSFLERVRFHHEDIRTVDLKCARYDLIVTNFFLDCFFNAELQAVVDRLARFGTPEGKWIVSEFREAHGALGRVWTQGVIAGLYAAFWATTGLRGIRLPQYRAALEKAGYSVRFEEEALGGLLYSSVWQAYHS
jgi:ubiquinone/menaquinone biosynthesis C-methylase UbiE